MYYKRFENCIPVKGANRSVICDLQRGTFDFIPNVLYEILNQDFFKLSVLIDKYGVDNKETIEEYINFLTEKEYCFLVSEEELDYFPPLSMEWHNPSQITNAIIEVDDININTLKKTVYELENVGCKYIELRAYESHDIAYLLTILSVFDKSIITSIELYVKYDVNIFSIDDCLQLISNNYRLTNVFLHSSTEVSQRKTQSSTKLFLTTETIDSSSHCGKISPAYFSINIAMFSESQNYNTCLNRKISINNRGEIKNCPSMKTVYGNITELSIKDILKTSHFTSMWSITKNQIEICKDCEFRHICSDCRAYISNSENIYSKPLKCTYNPYDNTWGEENPTNNPLYGK